MTSYGRSVVTCVLALVVGSAAHAETSRDSSLLQQEHYVGQHGYTLSLPLGYRTLVHPQEREGSEKVYFFPQNMRRWLHGVLLRDEGEPAYGAFGVIRLDVGSRTIRPPVMGHERFDLEMYRTSLVKSLIKDGEDVSVHDMALALPAIKILITRPRALVQVVIEGHDVMYMFTAGKDTPVLQNLVASLRDAAPLPAQPSSRGVDNDF